MLVICSMGRIILPFLEAWRKQDQKHRIFQMAATFVDLDALSAEDPLIRNLARIMRDGRGASLEQAVAEAQQYADPDRVEAAALRIRELAREIQSAQKHVSVNPQ